MYEGRIRHLEQLHEALDKKIDGLIKTGKFDDGYINDLKRQRLSLKDQISTLRRQQWEHDHESVEIDDE